MKSRIPIIQIVTIGLLPGFIKRLYYRFKGYKIGKGVRFGLGSIIDGRSCDIKSGTVFGFFSVVQANHIKIGYHCQIRSLTFIQTYELSMGSDVIISENAVIRAGHLSAQSKISIENKVHIFPHTIIDPSFPVRLCEECAVGFYSNIYTHGSYKNILMGYKVGYGAVQIGKRVELTYNVFVAPGVSVGDDAIVAYGSYVNRNIPEGVLAGGVPAVVKRKKEEFVSVPSYEDRKLILRKILREFCNFLIFSEKCSIEEIDNNLWKIKKKSQCINLILIFDPKCISSINEKDIAVIMFENENYILPELKQYFNVTNYSCSIIFSFLGKELKKYFSRYGIRFSADYDKYYG